MKESEYVQVTNLHKMQVVCYLLAGIIPDEHISVVEIKALQYTTDLKLVEMYKALENANFADWEKEPPDG